MRRETKDRILMSVIGIAFLLNITVIGFFPSTIKDLAVIGYVLLGFGFLLFALSVLTLRRKGTAYIVDGGIYGIVRHPMYLGGMILFSSPIFFSQHWIVVAGTVVAVVCCYLSMCTADLWNTEKFGELYELYMRRCRERICCWV